VKDFLPYGRQTVTDADVAAVADVLRGDWLTTGPAVSGFEEDFASVVGAPHAVACSSGTAALHMAAMALGLGPGDIAIVPSITFLATASAMRLVGADVVLSDVDPDTALMRPQDLEAALGGLRAEDRERVRVVLPVHMAGQPADTEALAKIAAAVGAVLVEDACHALGAVHRDDTVGACAHAAMATFSFHPVKTIAAGEGGMVTTRDGHLAEALARARNHGMTRDPAAFTARDQAFAADGSPYPWYYEMEAPAPNYRLSDVHAALARSQLSRLDELVDRRRALMLRYRERLAGYIPLSPEVPDAIIGWHLCTALIDFSAAGKDRATVMVELRERGIGSQVHYIPLHRQPYYRAHCGPSDLPGAEAWYARTLSLPLYPAMMDEDVDRVVDALFEILPDLSGKPA
jgi:UDP-4-amino-4,6-dideoxy-N-acetyl-beta-L-altrosamine transaminase